MKKIAIAVLMTLGMISVAQADKCQSWTHKAYPVTLEACSYENGGSGYAKITNNGNTAADVCWSVVSNSGNKDKGCYSNMPAGESTSPSCFQCGTKNGGVQYILLEKYKVVN